MNETKIITKEYVTIRKRNFLDLLGLYLKIPMDSDIIVNRKNMETIYTNIPITNSTITVNFYK